MVFLMEHTERCIRAFHEELFFDRNWHPMKWAQRVPSTLRRICGFGFFPGLLKREITTALMRGLTSSMRRMWASTTSPPTTLQPEFSALIRWR